MLGRPEPGLPPRSSWNISRYGPLLSLISRPTPPFCSADLSNPCWSTLRRGQPSTRYLAEESRLNVCSHLSVAFAVGFPGLHKTPAEPKSRPPNLGTWPLKPKNSFWTKIHDYALLRLEDVTMGTAAISHLNLFIPKLYFEAKTPVSTPFLYQSSDQPAFFRALHGTLFLFGTDGYGFQEPRVQMVRGYGLHIIAVGAWMVSEKLGLLRSDLRSLVILRFGYGAVYGSRLSLRVGFGPVCTQHLSSRTATSPMPSTLGMHSSLRTNSSIFLHPSSPQQPPLVSIADPGIW